MVILQHYIVFSGILLMFFGFFIGSFLNVIIDRSARGESFLVGRSHCDFCHHSLAWYDLIPIVSYTLLKGRCRYCKKPLGSKYPLIEFFTGFFFTFTFFWVVVNGYTIIASICLFIIISGLIIIFFEDLFYGFIPDMILGTEVLVVLFLFFFLHIPFLQHILSGVISAGLFLFLFLITKKKGMGFGDVKYAFFMGLLLGFPYIIPGLYLAFLTGALYSLILILWYKKPLKGTTIPFGPFLIFGTVSAYYFGGYLWQFILRFLQI